jgi:hypothetical protein
MVWLRTQPVAIEFSLRRNLQGRKIRANAIGIREMSI